MATFKIARYIARDIDINPCGVMPVVNVNQYDTAFTIQFRIVNSDGTWTAVNDSVLTPEKQVNATLRAKLPDGTVYENPALYVEATGSPLVPPVWPGDDVAPAVYVSGHMDLTPLAGRVECSIILHNDNGTLTRVLGMLNFILMVEPTPGGAVITT